jgi:hypothetical protein
LHLTKHTADCLRIFCYQGVGTARTFRQYGICATEATETED